MPRTRVFKSGNSQAVRIPAELAYPDLDVELEITRTGDVVTIIPARRKVAEAWAALRALPDAPMPLVDERIDIPDRPAD